MYIQSDLENKIYEISKRNFLDDYANYKSKKIDMTLSGKYLYKYPKFKIRYSSFSEYPTHRIVEELVKKIKEINNIKEREIVVGTGANGIVQNIVKILFKDGGNLVTPFLTFNQPEYAVTSMGGLTKRVYMESDGQISEKNIIKSIDKETKMIYVCNPNNPTGILLSNEKIKNIAKNTNSYVVIDESAIEFSDGKSLTTEDEIPDNIIILKSLSKAYGIANLRVGYMVCSTKFKKIYEENITVNEVSGISCEYAKKIISSKHYRKNIRLIIKEREKIQEALKNFGVEFYNSKSNILFSKNELNNEVLNKFNESNLSLMWAKDQYGENHFRIAVQDKRTNKIFVKKCKEIL